ncbi:MAG TPA: hypothetical protein VFH27_00815 [Longimicrobiaceae bacterium]|nr:hypothetical protein [Longimicrobiaceae bacterium]
MSKTFTDPDLQTWEAYASAGESGLASGPRIVFQCVSAPTRRPRFAAGQGDEADAEAAVLAMSDEELRALLASSRELP